MNFKITLMILCLPLLGNAQSLRSQFMKDLITNLAENLPDDYDFSELEEQLLHFTSHPLDLNKTTFDELNLLPFLSPLQITDILLHRKSYGPLIDVLELQQIESLDLTTIRILLSLTKVTSTPENERINSKNIIQFGKHELLFRFGSVVETSKGFTDLPGSRYLGSKERLMLKYRYTLGTRVSASFIVEKDAGEPVFKAESRLTDFQSAHLAIYKIGKFDKIVLGDYTLQFGQGLTLWSGFTYGKSPDVSSIVSKSIGLKPYTSVNEYAFFRGLATQVAVSKKVKWIPFLSFRKLDASLSATHSGELVLSSINETGLHRTSSEIRNQRSLAQLLFGSAIEYQAENLTVGAIAYHQKFNHSFVSPRQLYTIHQFKGDQLTNWGIHYRFSHKNTFYFGEFSKGSTGKWANVNGLLTSLSNHFSAVLVYRNYAPDFHNFYSEAMSEGSESANESGIYAGFNFAASKTIGLSFYIDHFKFPWLKFRVDEPSAGREYLTQLVYNPNKRFKMLIRHKLEYKQQNTDVNSTINFLDDVRKQVCTTTINWQKSKAVTLQCRLEAVNFNKGGNEGEFGFLIAQDIDYSPARTKWSGNIRVAYFQSEGYDSRMYAYEDDVLYNISFGMYNGKGWRNYLNLKYKLGKHLDCWFRYAVFIYPGMTAVGSGLDEITGNKKTDLKFQLRYQF